MPIRSLSYGAFDLQTYSLDEVVRTVKTNVFTPAPRNVQIVKLAQKDGGVYNGGDGDLQPKPFYISGTLKTNTQAATDLLVDRFLMAMNIPQSNFEIDHAAGRRRFICTPEPPLISRDTLMAHAGFVVNFIVPSGVGTDVAQSALIGATPISGPSSSVAINVGGTYKTEPTIKLTYSTITGGTAKTVTITNGTTLRGIQVTRNWASGDVLDLDSEAQTLYVNSIPVNFNGVFPEWEPGAGAITILDDFTARSGSIKADYTRRWL